MGAGRRPDGASDVGGPLSGSPGGSRLTISHSDAESDAEWDAFVARLPRAPHVQTSMWGALKSLLGWRGQRIVVRRDGGIVGGCQLLVRRVGPAAVAYAPRGPLGAPGDQEALVVSLEATWELARRLRVS